MLKSDPNLIKEFCPYVFGRCNSDFEMFILGREYLNHFPLFYFHCTSFWLEYSLYLRRNNKEVMFPPDWNFFENDNFERFNDIERLRLNYVKNDLSIDILNYYFGSDGFQAFKIYQENLEKIESNKKEIDDFIVQKNKEIDSVKLDVEEIKKHTAEYNFVGVSKAFKDLLEQKK